MKPFHYLLPLLLGSLGCLIHAQEDIPVAEPVEEGNAPLKADPAADQLRIADMLFLQAQESKGKPEEFRRLMNLTAQRYAEYVRANPNSEQVPLALYRLASCLMDSGQEAEAYKTYGTIVQRYKGDVAAAAAYRLATEAYKASNWANAERFYLTTIEQSTKPELKADAGYRLGRVYVAQNKADQAEKQFQTVMADEKASAVFRQASVLALAELWASGAKKEEAYAIYKQLLTDPALDAKTRGGVMLQAASLASLLNKDDEAQGYYDMIIKNPELSGTSAEAQAGLMFGLYKQGKYADVIKFHNQGEIASQNKNLEAKRRLVVGQSYFNLKEYKRAVTLFLMAEKSNPNSEIAMEAGYRKLLAQNELKEPDIAVKAQQFLNTYARAFPNSPWPEMARLLAAESLFNSDPKQAAAFYDAIKLDKIDESLRPTILYRDAWVCAKAGNRERAIILLSDFIKTYPKDDRVAVATALKGDMYYQTGRETEALQDFETVIKTWPRNEAAATAWQKAAQIYQSRQDTKNMIKHYEGLLKNFPKAMPSALSEARFNIAVGYFDLKDFENAIPNFEEARTLNPEKYEAQADMRIILSYYQLQNADKLKASLEALRQKDPKLLERVPQTIPGWLGMQAFSTKDYETADRYLTLATKDNELKRVKRLIWRNLAKSRLELGRYQTALVAVDFYLEEERQPYGRVEGQWDRARILLGLGKYADARKEVEEALAVGVEGPLMASLKITLGDIAFAEKKYDEAAKQYATTAELFVSDKVLKPEALYKAHAALLKSGRTADAAEYKNLLQKEFPGWTPSGSQELPHDSR